MINKCFIALVRHSEAHKNVNKRHGGIGTGLTKDGQEDSILLAKKFSKAPYNFSSIIYSPKPQCKETAIIIGQELQIPIKQEKFLKPIHLGIIDGLSENEVKSEFPNISLKLSDWRNGKIEINELSIPEMEDRELFYERGKKMVNKLVENKESSIVILTRSLLVLITSILLKRTTEKGGKYKEIKWKNSEYAVFSFDENGINFHISLSDIVI